MTVAERLRRADWTVAKCPHADAVVLLTGEHYTRSAPNTATYCHGLYRSEDAPMLGALLGVALWIPPTRTAAEKVCKSDPWTGVLALSRFVCAPEVPANGESFLLAASMRGIDRDRWPVLLTYADTAHGHDGTIYRACGWTDEGLTPAGDTWVGPRGEQRGRKRGGGDPNGVSDGQVGVCQGAVDA